MLTGIKSRRNLKPSIHAPKFLAKEKKDKFVPEQEKPGETCQKHPGDKTFAAPKRIWKGTTIF